MTAVANSVFTAAQFNTHVRDNLNETAPAKATAGGQIFVATAANAIAARTVGYATVDSNENTASTTYADLATAGPSVTVTTGTLALVIIGCLMGSNTVGDGCAMSYAVSGATTASADDGRSCSIDQVGRANQSAQHSYLKQHTLTAGSNTFTAKYRAITGGTATFVYRHITVIPLN
jgi:hypothetical protein